ncbi:chitinase-3-like protein 1 [Stomoxys calcitrans]|uniref:chitinase-3-like protein 1 n=1 Tax=Stomoxys calcitrans TaxID=35570 RepID=UPI0027E28ADB|nr:chitinase-3-like protein 1 [Stomoxys calcitrans]
MDFLEMPRFWILLIALCLCNSLNAIKTDKMVNCYYSSWSHNDNFRVHLDPKDIDPYLCTHLSFAFLNIGTSGQFNVEEDLIYGLLNRTLNLKWRNPSLKILAVVGGSRISSTQFSLLAASESQRSLFKYSLAANLLRLGFDGLDLHWLYPGSSGVTGDKQNFVTLLSELKETLQPLNLEFGVTVSGKISYARKWYDVANIAKHVDFINIMTYNYTDGSSVAHDAPLFSEDENNVHATIQYWIDEGVPASKLNMGVAFTSRTFIIWNNENLRTNTGIDVKWPFSDIDSEFKPYAQMCHLEYADLFYNTSFGFDVDAGASFVQDDVTWIGYESPRALEMKMNYLQAKKLGGVMVWSLQNDDFLGTCSEKYPLLQIINRKLDHRYECRYRICCIKSIRLRSFCFYIE